MQLLSYLRTQVRANRLANHRLGQAVLQLSDDDFQAPRTGFFPSIVGTLNHLLLVDRYYLDCLQGRHDVRERALAHLERSTAAAWAEDQRNEDDRFIALLAGARAADLDREVQMPRATHVQREPFARVVAHLLAHQVHHRGQVHAMLSSTPVAPPQLDEFLMASEAHLRHDDLDALGWTESMLFEAD